MKGAFILNCAYWWADLQTALLCGEGPGNPGGQEFSIKWNTEVPSECEEKTYFLWGCQSTRTGCTERLWSLSGDTQNLPGCDPAQPAVDVPALAGVGLDEFPTSLPTSTILWFCDSIILWFMCLPQESQCSVPNTHFPKDSHTGGGVLLWIAKRKQNSYL